jgi:hypothetical protein
MPEDPEKCQKGALDQSIDRTPIHFLGCMDKVSECHELVQLAAMTGKDEPVEHKIIILVDRLADPFTMTRHLDHAVWLLWIKDASSFDKLCDTTQIDGTRGRILRFRQVCTCPPGILQDEQLDSTVTRLLGIALKPNIPRPTRLVDCQSGSPCQAQCEIAN